MNSDTELTYNIRRPAPEEVGEDSLDPLLILCGGGCMPTVETIKLYLSIRSNSTVHEDVSIPQQSKHFLYPVQIKYDPHS